MALIHIDQWPQPIEARKLRILEAALDAGVPYPHGCGTGDCGSCKTLLIRGDVSLDPYSKEALSDEERAKGVVLACRARVNSDVYVRWVTSSVVPRLPMLKVKARVAYVGRVSHDVVVLRLVLPSGNPFAFRPGQFAKLRFAKLPARSYSMANQPGEPELEFHVRMVPDGQVSGYVATQLKVGESVEVRGPFGDAYWHPSEDRSDGPLLLLAGGTGMAPMLSVLDAALGDGVPPEQIHVYHGVRGKRDLYADDRLQARMSESGFRFVPVYSHDRVDNARQGLLHEAVAKDFGSLESARIYVAGPPPMVDAVKDLATERGAMESQIRADPFYAAEPEKKGLWERITGWGGLTGFGDM
jgi:naphthalene 1,2-dioxygenase ferredoxin reductase component